MQALTVTDLDDQGLRMLEVRARRATVNLLRSLFPLQTLPHKDEAGTLRHGFGRPIEKRPITERVASMALTEEILQTQTILRGRVFELVAVHPQAEDKLPYLYAIGDLLGAEQLRGWSALWTAMRQGDWLQVGTELMVCQWDKYYGAIPEKRRAVFALIMAISAPVE